MEDELKHVLRYYDLGVLRSVSKVDRGFVNENWILQTSRGKYFLKRRPPELRNSELIRAQHALINHLQLSGFPAPTIVPARSGETLLVLNGEFYEILEYIEGSPYDHSSLEHFKEAAMTLAKYHACVQGFEAPALCDPGERYCPEILDTNLTRVKETWTLDRDGELSQTLQKLEAHAEDLSVRRARYGELPYLVIHGDYYAGNLLFHGDKIIGVVDYDRACWQPRIVELAEALIYFTSARPGHLKHLVYSGFLEWDKFESFLRSYGSGAISGGRIGTGSVEASSMPNISLKLCELDALPDYIRCVWLSVSLQRLLEKDSCKDEAAKALQEVLVLGDWSLINRQTMIETSYSAMDISP